MIEWLKKKKTQLNVVKSVEPEKCQCQISVSGHPECCLAGYEVQ